MNGMVIFLSATAIAIVAIILQRRRQAREVASAVGADIVRGTFPNARAPELRAVCPCG
jgi:hypothetical protein